MFQHFFFTLNNKTLSFLLFRVLSQRFGIALSTAHRCTDLLITLLYRTCGEFIKFPSIQQLAQTAQDFSIYGFPNVVGAVDGTHITIKPPLANKNDYCSRKMQFAINLTATCNAKLEFTSVFTGYSAKAHDARVFKASPLYEKLNVLPRDYHILGDAAYPLQISLMTPYKDYGTGLSLSQALYNYKHSQTRMTIERSFGLLKGRWRKLSYLDCELQSWNKIIMACCVLHNICQKDVTVAHMTNRLPVFNVAPNINPQRKQQMIEEYLTSNDRARE